MGTRLMNQSGWWPGAIALAVLCLAAVLSALQGMTPAQADPGRVTAPHLRLRVNQTHDWVDADTTLGATVEITVTDALGTVKGGASGVAIREGGAVWAGDFDWVGIRPDITVGDRVDGSSTDGSAAVATVVTITGTVDVEGDTLSGRVLDVGYPATIRGEMWEEGAPEPETQTDLQGRFSLDFSPFDIGFDTDVAGWYVQPDGSWVGAVFRASSLVDTVYVDGGSGHDAAGCGSIDLPCRSISFALHHRATSGATVRVAHGTYTENLTIDTGVALMGGYEPINWTRSITLYETVLDGNRTGSVVVFRAGSDEAVLSGFTVRGGQEWATGGGGIVVENASPTIMNNMVTDNIGDYVGGGILIRSSEAHIVSNTITGNVSGYGGGGIEVHDGSPTIEDNTISHNTALEGGGVKVWHHSFPLIEGNKVVENWAKQGGGLLVTDHCSPTIRGNVVISNVGELTAGGAYIVFHSSPTIEGNSIAYNAGGEGGGGVLVALSSSPLITGNDIAGNVARYGGGIQVWHHASPTVEANTVTGNSADDGAGIYVWDDASATVISNTFAHNQARDDGGALWISYSSSASGQEGKPLPDPDIHNTYVGNTPGDIYAEPDPPSEPTPGPGEDLLVPQVYSAIQQAIDAAQDGDTVIVAPGTYTENIRFNGRNITVRSEDPADPDIVQSTILDGGANGSVVTFDGQETPVAVLAGLTIRNGSADQSGGGILCSERSSPTIVNNLITENAARFRGGGIHSWNSAPTIINNTVTSNTAGGVGGGIDCAHASAATLSENAIYGNTAEHGGGIHCEQSSPIIQSNVISGNSARAGLGGGIKLGDSSAAVISNTVTKNVAAGNHRASGEGGGIAIDCCYSASRVEGNLISHNGAGGGGGGFYLEHGHPELRYNVVEENEAGWCGGMMTNLFSAALMERNVIQRNQSQGDGGGLCLDNYAADDVVNNSIVDNAAAGSGGGIRVTKTADGPTIRGDLIVGNHAAKGGGIACSFGASCAVINNTLVQNEANTGRAVVAEHDSVAVLTNTIVWHHGGDVGPAVDVDDTSRLTITYSDIEQGWPGTGNVAAAPRFVDPSSGDYHLRFGSPCIDSGIAIGLAIDFEGQPRPFDGDGDGVDEFDIGADEWTGIIRRVYLPLTYRAFDRSHVGGKSTAVW